jgi:hypothetical protein
MREKRGLLAGWALQKMVAVGIIPDISAHFRL